MTIFIPQDVETKCPDNCSCYIININDPLWVKVTCSELNLTKLPDSLPPNTQVLNVSYNMVSYITAEILNVSNNTYGKLRNLLQFSKCLIIPMVSYKTAAILNVSNNAYGKLRNLLQFSTCLIMPMVSYKTAEILNLSSNMVSYAIA